MKVIYLRDKSKIKKIVSVISQLLNKIFRIKIMLKVRGVSLEFFFISCVLIILALLIFISQMEIDEARYRKHQYSWRSHKESTKTVLKYLINTTNCKIPDADPFHEEIENFYHREEYSKCNKDPLLSYIEKNNDFITLNINQSLIPLYSSGKIHCCYSKVVRHENQKKPDDTINISECIPFEKSVVVVDPLIMVKCKNAFAVQVYSNVHATISLRHVSHKKIYENIDESNSNPSVLFVGIDSISKQNLIRCMPETYDFLEGSDFINLKGYTKVGLNTLPNLMGIFAGLTMEQVKKTCDYENKIDECPNIWKNFSNLGYITAYGEDATSIGSFNYEKKGFTHPPTDFYFRPYILAAMKLGVFERENMDYCAGPETEGERIMNLATDFQITLKKYPKFGLFWMNSFSHDDLNMPSAMDERVKEFLDNIYHHLDNTIMFFFSDHGFRFGEIRKTHSGWLEERLPFFYIYLPESFKKKYPDKYKNLLINSKRLTNAFDIYMTLQEILLLSNKNYTVVPSKACPKCHSLFKEISIDRTCSDASIHNNWCVCNVRTFVSPQDPTVRESAHFFVDKINKLVHSYQQGDKCSVYQLEKITYSGESQELNEFNQTRTSLLLRVKLEPEANFEGVIEITTHDSETQMRLTGSISRLDRYAPVTKCIRSSTLERYCYCKKNIFTRIRESLCLLFYC